MSEEAARARIQPWLAPISEASPAGEDARYEPLHEEIRNEAAKLDSPTSGMPEWAKIAKDGEKLTTTLAKDLLIESYVAYALFEEEGLLGLASGLFLLSESMDQYWDVMHPPARRVRARVNAINWLTERLDMKLADVPIGADDHDNVAALDAAVKRLRAVVADKFEDQAPGLRPLQDTVQRLQMSLPERAGAPASDTEPPPAPAAAPAAAPEAAAPAAAPEAAAPAAAPEAAAPAAPEPAAPEPAKEETAEDRIAKVAEQAAIYTAPIPGDNPAGIDAKYEPDHEELRTDITSLDSPTGGNLEWPEVVPRAGKILQESSKDLLIGAYLAFALWETRRLEGLAVGLEVLTQICEQYWEHGFPPARRIRGRANALSWLLERLEDPLPAIPLQASDRDDVMQLSAVVKRFISVVRDKFEDAAPSLRPLQNNVERLLLSVPEPVQAAPPPTAAAPAPQAAAPSAPKPAAKPSGPSASVALGGGGAALADPKEVGKFAKDLCKSLTDAAKVLREAAPADPSAYHFMRVGLSLGVKAPSATGGVTMVPDPPPPTVKDIETQLSNGNWESLLAKTELTLITKRYWLDLHRYSAVALGNLGTPYEAARQAVLAGTAMWVRAYPELLDLSFKGGLPFASDVTKQWIESEVMPSSGGGGGGGGGGGEGADVLAQAGSLAAGGKVDEALELLSGLAFGARSGRARFQAKLAMAQGLAGKAAPAARGIYEGLVADIGAYGLEAWEPELVADCYRGLFTCLKGIKKDPVADARSAEVYQLLCRVDPVGAVKLA